MSTKPFRAYKDDLEKLKIAAASSGKSEKDILHELLDKAVPEEVKEELIAIAKARHPKRKLSESVTVEPLERPTTEIGSRIKSIIADAVETKVYLKTLGISLGDEKPEQPQWAQYPPWMMPQQPRQEPKKDIKEWVMELKAIESLEKKETDPAILTVLKEMKDSVTKALERKEPEKKEATIEDMMKWMMMYRSMGQPEQAEKMQQQIAEKMNKLSEELHQTQREMDQKEATWRHDDLMRQLNEIKNAPTQFDQIMQISQLSEHDPAIKAYVYKKLGIKEKGEPLSPEKLGDYIKQIKVPLGDILAGAAQILRGRAEQVQQPPPPQTPPGIPVTEAPTESPEEAAIAAKALGFGEEQPPPPKPKGNPPTKSDLPKDKPENGGKKKK